MLSLHTNIHICVLPQFPKHIHTSLCHSHRQHVEPHVIPFLFLASLEPPPSLCLCAVVVPQIELANDDEVGLDHIKLSAMHTLGSRDSPIFTHADDWGAGNRRGGVQALR